VKAYWPILVNTLPASKVTEVREEHPKKATGRGRGYGRGRQVGREGGREGEVGRGLYT